MYKGNNFDFLFQKAQILGFPTHSSFVLDMRMAKTAEAVTTFLTDLSKKLQALKESEMKLFLEYKKEEARFFCRITVTCKAKGVNDMPEGDL